LVRVLLHDGFFTTCSEPIEVELPERPPEAAILHPHDGQKLIAGRTMHLWGSIADIGGRPLKAKAFRWQLDDKEVGNGLEMWLKTPPSGEHRLTFTADGPGGLTEVTVHFTTVDYPEKE
jgi:hypothetical protein